MTERGKQLQATADQQITELVDLIQTLGEPAWRLPSGKMSSWSAISPARIPLATSAAGVFGASIPASMSVSIPPG